MIPRAGSVRTDPGGAARTGLRGAATSRPEMLGTRTSRNTAPIIEMALLALPLGIAGAGCVVAMVDHLLQPAATNRDLSNQEKKCVVAKRKRIYWLARGTFWDTRRY